MWNLNSEQLAERRKKETKEITEYCEECGEETPHISEEGHNGFDSWNNSYCLVCAEREEKASEELK